MYQPISLKFIMVQPFVTSLQEKIWFHVCLFFSNTSDHLDGILLQKFFNEQSVSLH